MHKRVTRESGFTLLELLVVMAIIGVLSVVAIPKFAGAMQSAREAVLREDLHVMRVAIDSYTEDKQKGPSSLDDLIQEGYLKVLPIDPMTRSSTTWVTAQGDSLHSLDQTDPGIDDVHSGSDESSREGEAYNTW